jgi:hypothetical protein
MAIVYEWSIPTTDYETDESGTPIRVTTIHWRCAAVDGELSASTYGTIGVDLQPSTLPDEAAAIAIVKTELPDVESELASQIGIQAAPTRGTGRIWDVPAGAAVWRSGTAYAVGDVAIFDGVPWTCLQAHTSQNAWTPPAVPALWSIQGQGGGGPVEWVAGEAVAIGDQRVFEGTTYEVIQAHTTQTGWEPPNVPALWVIV